MSYNTKGGHGYGGIRKAKRVQAKRSSWAKHIDSRLKAPKARSVDEWLGAPNRFDLPNVDTNKPTKETQPLERNVIDKDVLDANNPKVKAIYAKALKILKRAKIPYEIGVNGGVYVAYDNGMQADKLLEKCIEDWYKYYHSPEWENS